MFHTKMFFFADMLIKSLKKQQIQSDKLCIQLNKAFIVLFLTEECEICDWVLVSEGTLIQKTCFRKLSVYPNSRYPLKKTDGLGLHALSHW